MSVRLLHIRGHAGLQRRFVCGLPVPTLVIAQLQPIGQSGYQLSRDSGEAGRQQLEVGPPVVAYRLTGACQITGPDCQFLVANFTMPQQFIALFNTPLETLPLFKEAMFHVKHTPIQVLSPGGGRAGQ